MIDYELFKNILSQKDEGYIEDGDFIDNKTFCLLATSPINKMKALFKKGGTNGLEPKKYYVELQCPECKSLYTRHLTFNKMYEYLRNYAGSKSYEHSVDLHCDRCKQVKEQREKEESRLRHERAQARLEADTKEYIKKYLDPDSKWKKGIPLWKKWEYITQPVDSDVVADHIKGMKYQDFLNTPYWKTIAEKKKFRDKKCAVCNSTENLNVHHRTYEHHGYELRYMWKDLVCLCHECHEKYHFNF